MHQWTFEEDLSHYYNAWEDYYKDVQISVKKKRKIIFKKVAQRKLPQKLYLSYGNGKF